MKPLNIGFGNMVMGERVIAIINPDSAPSKRLRDEAKQQNRLIDATLGRKTKTLIITDSNHVIMSAINPETISARIEKGDKDE
ncbi:Extracellular matrix regulatory protein A [Fusobacterium sp. DD29]|uniref:DUF370 domain-containing protein n=1 Tax=unclassified Fusobacterium TaxID=2648384 RepID=UPI001B8D510E|nr:MULTISPECIES: DUF370 domain-containing protein [unclassified Fusobacterium]MBR8701923.1 Extracellular matrix regulatory protein A [Fusobacterium sp. DD45]MBR8711712.1 Extracellular matrix regulatory protein A [Fusobacterium sp. DD28]MBR8750086.1 Extracellular matrix regulatory protein A [Fusobacterium sp. DD29]MBR8752253.1 Extracellular matrix regulatory protein A [Fusobacterium sp. DD26]MBR8762336.1 Extracellular matrix regulatory protein A [Fusobacterium sp. DD25]